jgi:hypothetical protein
MRTEAAVRLRRRTTVVWSSSSPRSRTARHATREFSRRSPIRRFLRTGALLTIIGMIRLSRIARAHLRPTISLTGTAITVAGISLPGEPVLIAGFVVLLLALFMPSDPAEAPPRSCGHWLNATPFMPKARHLPPAN